VHASILKEFIRIDESVHSVYMNVKVIELMCAFVITLKSEYIFLICMNMNF